MDNIDYKLPQIKMMKYTFNQDADGDVLSDIEQSCFGMIIKSVTVITLSFALVFTLLQKVF